MTTTYKINSTLAGYFVTQTFAPDHFIEHGPYKNEESAKRRIRDLKRKDAEQAAIVADMQATGMMPDPTETAMAINYPSTPNVPIAGPIEFDPEMMKRDRMLDYPPRQVGCYPAISKHAYRR